MQKPKNAWRASAMLTVLLLQACATSSPPPRPTQEVRLTPLPASVNEIATQPSASWQEKASSWLLRLEAFSTSATPTCKTC